MGGNSIPQKGRTLGTVSSIGRQLGRLRRQHKLDELILANAQKRHRARLTVAMKNRNDTLDKAMEILAADDGPEELARLERTHVQNERDYQQALALLAGDTPRSWARDDQLIRGAAEGAGDDDWILTGTTPEELMACHDNYWTPERIEQWTKPYRGWGIFD